MQVWAYPMLIGIVLLAIGIIIFLFPHIVNFIIAALFVIGGVIMLVMAFSMWNETKKLEQVIEEAEREVKEQLKKAGIDDSESGNKQQSG